MVESQAWQLLDDVVTACWHTHEREQWETVSERNLKQDHGGLIPGPSRRTTDPSLQAKGSSDIQWQVGTQITAVRSKHLPGFCQENFSSFAQVWIPSRWVTWSFSLNRLSGERGGTQCGMQGKSVFWVCPVFVMRCLRVEPKAGKGGI